MSIFFSADAKPCCKYCRNELPGRSLSGHCPHCGHWYAVQNATILPGRIRAVAMMVKHRPASLAYTPMFWQTVAAVTLIVGNAALVVVLGRMALRALYRACGMNW